MVSPVRGSWVRSPNNDLSTKLIDNSKVPQHRIHTQRSGKCHGEMVSSAEVATQPGFLSLPPELRNYIYRLALCDKVVHVTRVAQKRGDSRCAHFCVSQAENAPGIRFFSESTLVTSAPSTGLEADGSLTISSGMFSHTNDAEHNDKLSMSLLQTCRQVHAECSMLPYTDNIFAFCSSEDLFTFAKRCKPKQAKAISKVMLSTSGQAGGVFDIPTPVVHRLRGVTTLLVEIAFARKPWYYTPLHDFPNAYNTHGWWQRGLERLALLPLRKVSIQLSFAEFVGEPFNRECIREWHEWAAEVEQNMLEKGEPAQQS